MCMRSPDLSRAMWRKSSHSQPTQSDCVEITGTTPNIAVRDSKDPHGPFLLFGRGEWQSFAARIKRGLYDSWP
jgi:Domain of unknown function (DUF397)